MTNIAFELFLLSTNLAQFKSKVLITKVFIESINSIFTGHEFSWSVDESNIAETKIQVCTRFKNYGYIHFNKQSNFTEEAFSLLQNAVQLLAIQLEIIDREKLFEKAEEALAQEKVFIEALLESVPGYFYVYDDEGNLIRWNKKHETMTGYSAEELSHMNMSQWFEGDDAIRVAASVEEVMTKGHGEVTANLLIKGGGKLLVNSNGVRLDLNGKTFFTGVGIDITERKHAEEIIKASESSLNSLINNREDAIWSIDKDYNLIILNSFFKQEYFRVFNMELKKGMNSLDVISPDMKPIWKLNYDKALSGERVVFEFSIQTANSVQFYEVFLNPILIDDGIAGVSAISMNITERKNAEKKLKSSDRIFFHSLDMLCIAGFDGYFKVLNPAWEKTLGWSNDELMQKSWLEFVHPDDRNATENVKSFIHDGKEIYQFENRYICKNGDIKWLSWNSFPYPEDVVMYGVARDVTERKLAEEALAKEKVFVEAIIESVPGMLYVYDDKGTHITHNKRHEEMTGYSDEELSHMNPLSWYDNKDDIARVEAAINDVFTKGYGEVDVPMRIKNGEKPIMHFTGSLLTIDTKKYFVGIGIDITERKLAEKVLRQREELLNKIFDVLPVGIWLADKNGNLTRSNAKGREIWGAEPLVGQEKYGVFKARSLPSGKELDPQDWALAHTIQEGVVIMDEMLEIDSFDGKKKVILNYTAPIFDNTGKVDGAVIVNLDITERKLAEEKILTQLNELRRWNEAMLDREERVLELKREVNELLGAEGKPVRYASADNKAPDTDIKENAYEK